MLKVNRGYVAEGNKPGFNCFKVRLTSESDKHMAYEFRTLENEYDKDLVPGILKPREIVTLEKLLPVDVDKYLFNVLYRETDASEKDGKAAMLKEGYYEGELIEFKK